MQIECTEYYICNIFVYISVAVIREKFLETRFIFIFRESTALDDLNLLSIVMCSFCFVAVFYTQVDGLFTKPAIAKEILTASALWHSSVTKGLAGSVIKPMQEKQDLA